MRILMLSIILSSIFVLGYIGVSESFAANPNDSSVYLVKSHNPVLKGLYGVRHNFDSGFTTFLNEHQVAGLEKAGFKLEAVPLYKLTAPPGACIPWPECKNGGGGDDDDTSARKHFPNDQTPYGIETIYNNPSITSTSGGSGIDVAVLDTGIYREHPDLVNRIENCLDFTGFDDCNDKNGHGTHVAGTIAADGGLDNLGIFGIAPEADIHAYKVCGNRGCYGDDIAAAITYAGSNGIEIISMSLGGDRPFPEIESAIVANDHILFVAAAGNDGPSTGSIDYPGAYAEVIAVGAINSNLQVPSWSSRGTNDADGTIEDSEVEFGAPGVSVESTWKSDRYNTISGTSMATPHVSGLAAKLWQGNAADTRTHLQSIASDIWTAGEDTATGLGLPQVP